MSYLPEFGIRKGSSKATYLFAIMAIMGIRHVTEINAASIAKRLYRCRDTLETGVYGAGMVDRKI